MDEEQFLKELDELIEAIEQASKELEKMNQRAVALNKKLQEEEKKDAEV